MSKQGIGWQVVSGGGDNKVIHRTFEDVPANLFDTFKETIEFYGEDFVLDALNGTSVRVQIQNHMRSRSTLRKDDDSGWIHTDKELIAYCEKYVPSVSASAAKRAEEYDAASPELRELMDAEADINKQKSDLKKRMVALKGQQKPQTSGTVVKDRKRQ